MTVCADTRLTRTPSVEAIRAESATARMLRPIQLRCTTRVSTMTRPAAIAIAAAWPTVMWSVIPPICALSRAEATLSG